MAKRKSLLHGLGLEDAVSKGVLRRVIAKDNALKMYALGYKRGNAEFAGWLLYAMNEIEKHRDELMRLSNKERATRVMDIVSQAAKTWKSLPSDEKQKWIENAKSILATEKSRIESDIKLSEEIEKLAEEAYRSIEELATVVT